MRPGPCRPGAHPHPRPGVENGWEPSEWTSTVFGCTPLSRRAVEITPDNVATALKVKVREDQNTFVETSGSP